MKTRGQDSTERKNFVESAIGSLLKQKQDFAFIRYAKASGTENEYMRIGDIQGRAITLNITGMNFGEIMDDIARIILLPTEKIAPPANIVTDNSELRRIAPMFI